MFLLSLIVYSGGGKLELDDLLAPLAGQSSNLVSLKKSAKVLASSSKKLSAPLPQRTADRLNREAAYEQTKEEVDKWKATMQRIREVSLLLAWQNDVFAHVDGCSGRALEFPSSGAACRQSLQS